MEFSIAKGAEYTASAVVTKENTASSYGSGLVDVFATPAMVGLMENACMNAVLPSLPDGFNTVGVEICVKHTKATPMGMKVFSRATLTGVEGKRLHFEVIAWDEEAEIGQGTHTRYIIETQRFIEKLAGR